MANPVAVVAAAGCVNEAMASSSTTDPEILEVMRQDGQARDRQITIRLRVQPGLEWFEGHFPEVALLPGVVQTSWVVQLGRRYFNLPPHFQSMSNMKFMRFIMPGTQVELHLKYQAAKGELAFEYCEGEAVCASGRMKFGFESQQ